MITKMLQSLTEREPIDPELQRYLSESGYFGRTAKCLSWRLVGVQRPGWVQVYEFHIRAKRKEGDWEERFGICQTDERDDSYEITLFDDQNACREACLERTSEMITAARSAGHWVKTMLMTLFLIALSLASIGAVVSLGRAEKSSEVGEPEYANASAIDQVPVVENP